jgi:quercetin dioxygenase-like cupin family protein
MMAAFFLTLTGGFSMLHHSVSVKAFMYRIIVCILALAVLSCTSGKEGVKTGIRQLPRDYSVPAPSVPVLPEVIAQDRMPWVVVDPNLKRKVYFNDRQTLVLVEWVRSDSTPDTTLHQQPHELTGYVLEGDLMITMDKLTQGVGPGGVFIVPSNVPYNLAPLSAKTTFLEVYTPPREDLRRSPPPVRFDENDIKSLVYRWFAQLDRLADSDSLLPFLSARGMTLRFPGALLKSREDFRGWYEGQRQKLKEASYRVETIQVSINQKSVYTVQMAVSRRATTTLGEDRGYRSRQVWVLIDEGGANPVITTMDVEEDKGAP